MSEPEVGRKGQAERVVTDSSIGFLFDPTVTAKAVGSGSLDVLSTPFLIALMEEAACNALGDLPAGNPTTCKVVQEFDHPRKDVGGHQGRNPTPRCYAGWCQGIVLKLGLIDLVGVDWVSFGGGLTQRF